MNLGFHPHKLIRVSLVLMTLGACSTLPDVGTESMAESVTESRGNQADSIKTAPIQIDPPSQTTPTEKIQTAPPKSSSSPLSNNKVATKSKLKSKPKINNKIKAKQPVRSKQAAAITKSNKTPKSSVRISGAAKENTATRKVKNTKKVTSNTPKAIVANHKNSLSNKENNSELKIAGLVKNKELKYPSHLNDMEMPAGNSTIQVDPLVFKEDKKLKILVLDGSDKSGDLDIKIDTKNISDKAFNEKNLNRELNEKVNKNDSVEAGEKAKDNNIVVKLISEDDPLVRRLDSNILQKNNKKEKEEEKESGKFASDNKINLSSEGQNVIQAQLEENEIINFDVSELEVLEVEESNDKISNSLADSGADSESLAAKVNELVNIEIEKIEVENIEVENIVTESLVADNVAVEIKEADVEVESSGSIKSVLSEAIIEGDQISVGEAKIEEPIGEAIAGPIEELIETSIILQSQEADELASNDFLETVASDQKVVPDKPLELETDSYESKVEGEPDQLISLSVVEVVVSDDNEITSETDITDDLRFLSNSLSVGKGSGAIQQADSVNVGESNIVNELNYQVEQSLALTDSVSDLVSMNDASQEKMSEDSLSVIGDDPLSIVKPEKNQEIEQNSLAMNEFGSVVESDLKEKNELNIDALVLNDASGELVSPDEVSAQKINTNKTTESYVKIKQGDVETTVVAEKEDVASTMNFFADVFNLNWLVLVPTRLQDNDSRYQYCPEILEDLKASQYSMISSYKINSQSYSGWRQKLGDVSLVQVVDSPLSVYVLQEGDELIQAVSTVFEVDEGLSGILPGIGSTQEYFYGALAFADNNQQGLGGAGRFYSEAKLKDISIYLLKWKDNYYKLILTNGNAGYKNLELIPFLTEHQSVHRNCRWLNQRYEQSARLFQ